MVQPSRKYSATDSYRYGFNGKENDDEVKSVEGSHQDYGMRIYDPRLGKFLSVDPLSNKFPYLSPYGFAGNSPLKYIDLDGGEPKDYVENWVYQKIMPLHGGKSEWSAFSKQTVLGWIDYEAIYDKTTKQYWFIHQGNDGIYYYWQHDPGANQMEYIASGKANGVWIPFETANAQRAKAGYASVDFLSTFYAVTIGGVIATEGAFLEWVAMALLEDALGIPIINSPDDLARYEARQVEKNTVKRYAFGVEKRAEALATQIDGEHLMQFKGDWKAEFKRLAGDAGTEFHFDLTDVTLSGKVNGSIMGDIINKPITNTQWEISTLFTEHLDKFKQTIFHYNGKEYKGLEILDLK